MSDSDITLVLSNEVIISYNLIPSWKCARTNEACGKNTESQTKAFLIIVLIL